MPGPISRPCWPPPGPGSEKYLAFYDHRVGHITTDPRLLLVPLDDHLCHRGDGLFESICFRERKIFALDEHLARMRDGAKALSLTPPCSWEELRERIVDVARASSREHGDLRVFLGRGPGGFGISPAQCPQAGLYIVALAKQPAPRPSLLPAGAHGLCQRHSTETGIPGPDQEHQLSAQCLPWPQRPCEKAWTWP